MYGGNIYIFVRISTGRDTGREERAEGGYQKTDADPFQILQHMEHMEWQTQVGATGDGLCQPGPGRSTGDEGNRQSLHPWVGRLQRRYNRCDEPAPRWSGSVLLHITKVIS